MHSNSGQLLYLNVSFQFHFGRFLCHHDSPLSLHCRSQQVLILPVRIRSCLVRSREVSSQHVADLCQLRDSCSRHSRDYRARVCKASVGSKPSAMDCSIKQTVGSSAVRLHACICPCEFDRLCSFVNIDLILHKSLKSHIVPQRCSITPIHEHPA